MIRRLLIANRGEIARRIARTCRHLGVEYVAVYSDADAGAAHLDGAVAAVRLGPAPAAASYLDIGRVIAAASSTGCDAVHPGYGFLAESSAFASAVADAGIVFVGPSPRSIAAMGDKANAKRLMAAAGVPVVPGSSDATDDPQEVARLTAEVGFPVLLKPVAGGGGKGMQVVESAGAAVEAARSAIRLARASFGDGRLLVERFVRRPRHVEVQIFGDHHGNVVHLFERECSLQRRHQKIVEEAPAPHLPQATREALLSAAVRGARAIGYRNAGTFEFILGPDGELFFLEVNTRLQVEHPVTEEITGLDLVEWQLRVASGERLPLSQAEIAAAGHAIECRVYAEDPAAGFRPTPGRALVVSWPGGLRVESGVVGGSLVPPQYDSMIAKLIARGRDRGAALAALQDALPSCRILGMTTNLGFLANLLSHRRVADGLVDTRFVDETLPELVRRSDRAVAVACAAAIVVARSTGDTARGSPWCTAAGVGPFDRRHLEPAAPFGRIAFRSGDEWLSAGIVDQGGGSARVAVDGAGEVTVKVEPGEHHLWSGTVGDRPWAALALPDAVEAVVGGWRYRLETGHDDGGHGEAAGLTAVAPMPGAVVAIQVKPGDVVEKGRVLLLVEAMKMENPVAAPADGIVEEVRCRLGEMVSADQVLVVLRQERPDPVTG